MIRERVTDPAEMAIYGRMAPLEGDAIEGVVIHRFPAIEEAQRWYNSAAYQAARIHRQRGCGELLPAPTAGKLQDRTFSRIGV